MVAILMEGYASFARRIIAALGVAVLFVIFAGCESSFTSPREAQAAPQLRIDDGAESNWMRWTVEYCRNVVLRDVPQPIVVVAPAPYYMIGFRALLQDPAMASSDIGAVCGLFPDCSQSTAANLLAFEASSDLILREWRDLGYDEVTDQYDLEQIRTQLQSGETVLHVLGVAISESREQFYLVYRLFTPQIGSETHIVQLKRSESTLTEQAHYSYVSYG